MNNFKPTNPKRVACVKCGLMTRNVADGICGLCELAAELQADDAAIDVHLMAAEPTHQYLDFTTEPGKATLWDEPAPGRYKWPIEEMRKLAINNEEPFADNSAYEVITMTNFLFDAIVVALEAPPSHIGVLLDDNSVLRHTETSTNDFNHDKVSKQITVGECTYFITVNPRPKDA